LNCDQPVSTVYSTFSGEGAGQGQTLLQLSRLHNLKVTFDLSVAMDGRFVASSGGRDWATYSQTSDELGSRVLSIGDL
jgi:hypothetical protein